MNIFNTPQMQVNGKAAKATGSNALDVLGNHKQLTPEQMKALQKAGKLKGDSGEFQTLFDNAKTTSPKKNVAGEAKLNLENKLPNQLTTTNTAKGQTQVDPKLAATQTRALADQAPGLQNHNRDIMNQPVGEGAAPRVKIPGLKTFPQQPQVANQAVASQNNSEVANVLKIGQSKNIKAVSAAPQANLEQVGEMASMNKSSALMKPQMMQSQVQAAKNPALNQNPNLVDFNTFMMKQNPQARQRINTQSALYENKNKSMFNKKVEDSLPGVVKKPEAPTKLQDVMFKSQGEGMNAALDQQMHGQNLQNLVKNGTTLGGVAAGAKVFDMSQMTGAKSSDEVISKIQDYAIQTKFSNEPQLDFSFKHQDLGQIDLVVQKGMGNELNIIIGSNTAEASQFFTQHKGELLQSLTQAGISVGDFKLDSSAKSNNQNLSQNSNGNGGDAHREHQSESGQREQERQRRSELWDQFADKEAA